MSMQDENRCTVDGVVYVAAPSTDGCEGCTCLSMRAVCRKLPCTRSTREDGRDVIWIKAADQSPSELEQVKKQRDDLLAALKLALEYWKYRKQRYKNKPPVWVEDARAAIAKVQP